MTLKCSSYVLAWLLYVSIYPSLVRQQIPMTGKESAFKMTGNIKLTQKYFHFYFFNTLFEAKCSRIRRESADLNTSQILIHRFARHVQ